MLGSIHRFMMKYPGLAGIPVYIFILAGIASAGSVPGGFAVMYTNIFNAAVNGIVPGLQILGKDVVMPTLGAVFKAAGAGSVSTGAVAAATPAVPGL